MPARYCNRRTFRVSLTNAQNVFWGHIPQIILVFSPWDKILICSGRILRSKCPANDRLCAVGSSRCSGNNIWHGDFAQPNIKRVQKSGCSGAVAGSTWRKSAQLLKNVYNCSQRGLTNLFLGDIIIPDVN